MKRWLATASALALLAASPALAQAALELGGGWFQSNPLGISDLSGPTGPTVDLAWTTWRNERTGVAVGVTSVFGSESYASGVSAIPAIPYIYGHVAWRRGWMNAAGRGYLHVGLGAGPMFWRVGGYGGYHLRPLMWHVELMGTRKLRDGLDLRAGVSTTPWLPPYLLLAVHPTVKAVWTF